MVDFPDDVSQEMTVVDSIVDPLVVVDIVAVVEATLHVHSFG